MRGGGGQRRHPNGYTFFDSPQTRGCVCVANQRGGLADVASPRVRPPGSSPRAPQPGGGSELWFLPRWWWCPVQDSAGRVRAPGAKTAIFTPKVHFGLKMVEFCENGAFHIKLVIFTKHVFWGRKGLRGDSGAEKVWVSLGFTRGWRGVTRKRGNPRRTEIHLKTHNARLFSENVILTSPPPQKPWFSYLKHPRN